MTYKLALFVSLNPKPPCFVIPVFTTTSSNGTFAQELYAGGRIREFMPFLPDDFTIVTATAPLTNVNVGEEGVLAFWFENGEVACGTSAHLKHILRNADVLIDSPFAEVERATFLEDHELLVDAAAAASPLLRNITARTTYHDRLKARLKTLISLRDTETYSGTSEDRDISSLISLLENEKDSQKWISYWREGWSKFNQDDRLIDIARWRIMTIGLGRDEVNILLYMRYSPNESLKELSLWWLNNRSVKYPGWVLVWDMVDDEGKSFPPAIVTDALYLLFNGNFADRTQWTMLNVWSTCFRTFISEKKRIIDIAIENDGRTFYYEYFIERIVCQIYLDDRSNAWAADKLTRWFMSVKGTSTWARLFALIGNELLSAKDFNSVATKWLRKYGRGTNKWFEIYKMVNHAFAQDEDWNIRVSWLNRARKDLYTWPEVFESLADDSGDENVRELSEIARSWQFQGRDQRSNDTIEDFAAR